MRRVLVVACVPIVVLAVYGALGARRHVARAMVREPVRELDVDWKVGDIVVAGGTRTDIRITHVYHYALRRPSFHRSVARGVLRMTGSGCSRFDFACTVRTRIDVPAQTRLRVRIEAGDIDVSGLRADVDVDADAGSVSVKRSTGTVAARTGTGRVALTRWQGRATLRTRTGDVVLDDARGPVRASVGEGDLLGKKLRLDVLDGDVRSGVVNITFAKPPQRTRLRTEAGGMVVRVPTGAYSVHARADTGRVRVTGITRETGGAPALDLRSGAGDIAVRGLASR
jgi:hypothetical protein